MAQESRRIDIANAPELLRVAEQVRTTQEPTVLRHNGEDVAVVVPVQRKQRPPSRARPVTPDDSLFRLIGIGSGRTPGGVSDDKHAHLAKAYRHR